MQKNKAIFTSVVRFINSAQAALFVVMFTKSLNKAYKKDCVLEFRNFSSPSYGLVAFKDVNTYILTESRNFKTFLMRENYIITLDSCNLFFKKSIEHRIEHVVDSIYGVFIHYTF